MKKLFSIFVAIAVLCSSLAIVTNAATADLVYQSVEGSAVIDGVKDSAYDSALHLVMDQNSKGEKFDKVYSDVYLLNDSEYVYVFANVYDTELDNGNVEVWAQDSFEVFWMSGNTQIQVRYHYDDSVSAASENNVESKVVLVDGGYDVEFKYPITDVLNNQIETVFQVNACSAGARDYTVFVDGHIGGDDAYQRANRESSYDCWWTLELAGEHEDTRKIPEPVDESLYDWELTDENYQMVTDVTYGFQLFTMDNVNYSWAGIGGYFNSTFGEPMNQTWTDMKGSFFMSEDLTAGYTKDPKFGLQINDHNFLTLPDGSEQGDTGDSAKFAFDYKDIVIKAEGYPDVVIPGAHYESLWTVVNMGSYNGGNNFEVDFVAPIKEQLGLDTKGLVEYMLVVEEVQLELNFSGFNGITYDELAAYEDALEAELEAALAVVQPFVDEAKAAVEAAKAVEGNDIEALNGFLATAQAAFDNAMAAAGENLAAIDLAEDAGKAVEDINKLIARAEQLIAEENGTAEEEAPAEDEEAPADEKPAASDEAKGGAPVGIIVAVVAAVVVIAVVLVLVLKKKKK